MARRATKINYTKSREYRVFKVFTEELYKGQPCIVCGRYYPWLLSPKGEPLELDLFFPEIPLAVEIQGKQHYEPSKIFFKKREDWKYYLECDKIKVEACKAYKLPLLVVGPDDPIDAESLNLRVKELQKR